MEEASGINGEWLTVSQASKLTGFSSRHLSDAIRKGKLSARKEGRFWQVDPRVLERFLLKEGIGGGKIIGKAAKTQKNTKNDSRLTKASFGIINEPIFDLGAALETGAVLIIFCLFLLCVHTLVGYPLDLDDMRSGTHAIGQEISQALIPTQVTQAAATILSGGK